MPDPAEQLARIYAAGFSIQTFDRFPRAAAVMRDGAVALLEPTPAGLRMIGSPGWRMGELMGVLVEENGRKIFRYKEQVIEATPERLDALARFRSDLEVLLEPRA
jgi:hypothetical protein